MTSSKPSVSFSHLANFPRKSKVNKFKRTKAVKACEQCKPLPHLTKEDHSPAVAELEYVIAKGFSSFMSLKPSILYFIQRYGFASYVDCKDRGYSPHLTDEEMREHELEMENIF